MRPITALIAKAIVSMTASSERDPKEGMERALNALGVRKSVAGPSGQTGAVFVSTTDRRYLCSGGQAT